LLLDMGNRRGDGYGHRLGDLVLEAALTMLRRVHLRNMPMVILPMKL
jgi:hypothetical protein